MTFDDIELLFQIQELFFTMASKTVPFCEYLYNENTELYEILNLSSNDTKEMPEEFS